MLVFKIAQVGENNHNQITARQGAFGQKIIAEIQRSQQAERQSLERSSATKPTSRAAVLGKPEAAALCVVAVLKLLVYHAIFFNRRNKVRLHSAIASCLARGVPLDPRRASFACWHRQKKPQQQEKK